MKNTFIAKAGLFAVALPLFVLIQAPSSAANNEAHDGNNRIKGSCGNTSGTFPDSVFARLTTDIGGSVSGFEIHASYEGGNCTSMLYTTSSKESSVNSQGKNDLIVALN